MRIWTYLTHQICKSIENRYTNPNRKNRLPNIWVRFSEKKNLKQKANKPVLKIDPQRSRWWYGPFRNFEFYYMRKRSYSLDQIPVTRNKFDEGREEHPSKRFFQVHCNNFITFIKMHWKNLEITLTMKFVAILHFITILIVRYSKQIKLGRFSLI